MGMSSMELIPEHCRFISDSYIKLISVLAHTMGYVMKAQLLDFIMYTETKY